MSDEIKVINYINEYKGSDDNIEYLLININNLKKYIYNTDIYIETLNIEEIINNSPRLIKWLKIIIDNLNIGLINKLDKANFLSFVLEYIKIYNISTNYNDIIISKSVHVYNDNFQRELIKRIRNGDKEAKEELIVINENLVKAIISRNYYVNKNSSFEFEDILQEGRLGLLEAALNFDLNLKTKFSSYATFYIKRNASRAIYHQSKALKISLFLYKKLREYYCFQEMYISKYGYKPTEEEISLELNLPIKKVKEIMNINLDTLSLDQSFEGMEDTNENTLANCIADERQNVEDESILHIMLGELKDRLDNSNINERNKEIVKLRFGLYDGVYRKLDEIGKMYNLTRERIRVIIKSSLLNIGYDEYLNDMAINYPIKRRKK